MTAVMERLDSEEGAVFRLQPCQFLIPGLVDCHIHAPQFSFTGTATDVPLMDWLDVSVVRQGDGQAVRYKGTQALGIGSMCV